MTARPAIAAEPVRSWMGVCRPRDYAVAQTWTIRAWP